MQQNNPGNTPTDEQRQVDAFEARIAAGETIEPKDWMPDRYRTQLIRMMSQHAHSEIVGMLPEGNWITRAPSLRRKMTLIAKVQDEAGHGLYIYCGTETLGSGPARAGGSLATIREGQVLQHLQLSDPQLGRHGDDRVVRRWRRNREPDGTSCKASYGPYARATGHASGKEENFHKKQGYEIIATLSRGTPAQKAMAQDAVNRWWWPSLMMFGPSDTDSPNTAELIRWRVKRKTNDELRQRFIDLTVPQADAVGLTLPDPNLKLNADTGHYEFGQIDWNEFWAVVKGNGPCNRERLEARRAAHEGGRWVRDAATAYAAKRNGATPAFVAA